MLLLQLEQLFHYLFIINIIYSIKQTGTKT